MKQLTKSSIEELLQTPNRAPAITIYMPTHRVPTPPNMSEDQVRFKNLMNKVIDILKTREEPHELITYVEGALADLQSNKSFWQDQTEGLLICIRPDYIETFNLPFDCEEYVAVDDHFHLAPIYGYVSDEMEYYVLVLAQRDPALHRGNLYELRQAEVTLPKNLEEALNIDEIHQKSVQFHAGTGSNGGPAMYHGHGGGKDAGDNERLRFFRMIDDILCSQQETSLPLVIAGTESEVVEYKRISRYAHILDPFINGNYSEAPPNELHNLVRPIIEQEIIHSKHEAVLERFLELSGANNKLVATDFAAIKDAAEKGRIDTLAVGMTQHTRDTVRDSDEAVTKITFGKLLHQKSLDYIAQLVWSQSGKIVNLEHQKMPVNAPIFAIMRY